MSKPRDRWVNGRGRGRGLPLSSQTNGPGPPSPGGGAPFSQQQPHSETLSASLVVYESPTITTNHPENDGYRRDQITPTTKIIRGIYCIPIMVGENKRNVSLTFWNENYESIPTYKGQKRLKSSDSECKPAEKKPLDDVIPWRSENTTGPALHKPRRVDAEMLFRRDRIQPASDFNSQNNQKKPVKTGGNGKPQQPIGEFQDSDLDERILANLARMNITVATPIQSEATPAIMEGEDVMACAQTGSGKTAAYLLAIIDWIIKNKDDSRDCLPAPYAIIVAPTRELAKQIFCEAIKFSNGTGVKPVEIYGRTDMDDQVERVEEGCDIAIASIGRLNQLLHEELMITYRLKFLVLDEADRMLISKNRDKTGNNKGYSRQGKRKPWRLNKKEDFGLKSDIEKLFAMMPPIVHRQTLMFSATFPPLVQWFAKQYLQPKYMMIHFGSVGSPCPQISQTILEVKKKRKETKLINILQEELRKTERTERGKYLEKTLVFTRERDKAEEVARELREAHIPATCLHGLRHQAQRERVLQQFSDGYFWVLVATDVAARGLDIPSVDHVINFDLPRWCVFEDRETYVNRIGRTGRVGNRGRATSLFDPRLDRGIALSLLQCLRDVQQEAPAWLLTLTGILQPYYDWDDKVDDTTDEEEDDDDDE